jgi:hypothetical protein
MERRGANTWIIAVLAIAVGFLAALLIFRGNDNENTSATVGPTNSTTTQAGTGSAVTTAATTASPTSTTTTSTTQQGTAPQTPAPTVNGCVDLWNSQNNRVNQTFLVNVMSQQPIRVHVGVTSAVPPKCLITIVGNDGRAWIFPAGGGATFPYAAAPGGTNGSTLPPAQKTSNALEQRDGTLAAR